MTVQDDLNTVLNAVDRLYHYTDDRARAGLPGRSEAADDARRALARLESRLELTARAERLEKALLDIEKIGLIAHRGGNFVSAVIIANLARQALADASQDAAPCGLGDPDMKSGASPEGNDGDQGAAPPAAASPEEPT